MASGIFRFIEKIQKTEPDSKTRIGKKDQTFHDSEIKIKSGFLYWPLQ
jgi:hypothetical protein